ncbi:steroid 17-alpha-hydroxylase/17,20 lyase-like, partial [Polypterus senegalus]|uniref:steroid 17-alpha-hydroxylase/17,20 lyase-like n=1 Tax=Polypterus senegalus TaxID=55291 RepID=UPI0019653A04
WSTAHPQPSSHSTPLSPQIQKKIQEEMDNIIGLDSRPTLSDRGRLPYLEATIREVLRIRPVAPMLIPHVALEDSSIGEYTIPKGTRIVVNLWSIHHDDNEWPDSDKFDPGKKNINNPLQSAI